MVEMNAQGSRCDALADDVLQNIFNREALIERLQNLHQHQSSNRPPQQNRVQRLLYGLHNASLAVVESIAAWNLSKQDDWYRQKNIEVHSSSLLNETPAGDDSSGEDILLGANAPCPFNVFSWNGQNYLQKMLSDLDFVGDIAEAISFLGSSTSFHRNPFLLVLDVDDIGESTAPTAKTMVWKDANVQRVKRACFVILLDEFHRSGGSSRSTLSDRVDDDSRLRLDSIRRAKFRPSDLRSKDLEAYASMIDPPATVAVAICCAHLVLGSVDADVIDRLVYLTKAIVLKIFRQPTDRLVRNARGYNPLRHPRGNTSIVELVHPFILHQKMNPKQMVGIFSDQIVYMVIWLRALAARLVEEKNSNQKSSAAADRVFRELEADSRRGHPTPAAEASSKEKGNSLDDTNKENECSASKNASVQTEDISLTKQKQGSSQGVLETVVGNVSEAKSLVPFPVHITVSVREGSRIVQVSGGLNECIMLKPGDDLRIFDARESSNWTVADSPNVKNDGSVTFHLVEAYDHSRIVAQETNARNDTLDRLCYPYKKDSEGTPIHKPLEVHFTSERSRHVASDVNESIHSPLYIQGARVWKLIPEEEDRRPAWRREFDDGVIPWESENAGSQKSVTHFGVRVSLEMIEKNCIDSPYQLDQCVHQQRVNFFESVHRTKVIDETFHTVCKWHPKGTLIDNVKWAKLSRKMKFLSNVKNSKHEIDMAFVRHNQDRKLDLARFHAIFGDIALIQYPPLSKENALTKVAWASIVMIPDVNTMMWKEAKRLALNVEANRVCAQIRVSALVRRIIQQAEYLDVKDAAIIVAKYMRQFLARIFVSKILQAMREDEQYQSRWRSAKVVQKAWRRFFWRNRFLLHQERRNEEKRQEIAATRRKLQEMRDRERSLVVFRDVIRVDSTIAVVIISFRDNTFLQTGNSMLIKVYVPSTKEAFAFNLEENAIRKCLEKALSSEGKLSWDEMLKEDALKQLMNRLVLRVVRGRPIFLFSRRNIVEQGVLVDKRAVRAVGELFILSTFRSPHNFVFYAYQPSTRLQMRTKLSMPKLRQWLSETMEKQKEQSAVCLLEMGRQIELIEWLVKRVVIRENPQAHNMQILLQYEAEEERIINLVTKVQSQWRRLKSRRCAKEKTIHQYEKIYIQESRTYAYRNMLTDQRQWQRPKLLGDNDLKDPVDEWRREETFDPATGQKKQYYANYATGQSSWLSEEDAARLVQRRYRSKHESDLIGKKLQLPDIVKAMKFIHGARSKYEQDPHKLSNIVNFALLTHCLDLDFIRAKPIYEKALQQSPNHPLISRAYGIFLLASRQTPVATSFQTACRLFREANVVDPTQAKFQSATEIYFQWAVLVDSKSPLALLNFALLYQCIYRKFDHAEKIYRAALALDPSSTLVVENYHLFTDERYPGGEYLSLGPPYSVVRGSQVVEEKPDWAEWIQMIDHGCPKKGMEIFWFNRFTKETRFQEPTWSLVWDTRMKRSKCISGKASNWVEYWDSRTQSSFFYDVFTKRYTASK